MSPCQHKQVIKRNGVVVCSACGLDIAQWYVPAASRVPGSDAPPVVLDYAGVPLRTWLSMGIGLVVALVIVQSGTFVGFAIAMLGTLSHEMGHAVCGWILGMPSLPAFDLQYGGGITRSGARSDLLLMAYGALLAVYLWSHRANRLGCVVMGTAGLVLACCAYMGLSDILYLSAGHLGMLAITGIFLFRGLTGVAVVHGVERWLYAIIGWTLWLNATRFCWLVAYDPATQNRYLAGKGNIDNDFVRIADDISGHFDHVALLHLGITLLVPVVVWAVWRWRQAIGSFMRMMIRMSAHS